MYKHLDEIIVQRISPQLAIYRAEATCLCLTVSRHVLWLRHHLCCILLTFAIFQPHWDLGNEIEALRGGQTMLEDDDCGWMPWLTGKTTQSEMKLSFLHSVILKSRASLRAMPWTRMICQAPERTVTIDPCQLIEDMSSRLLYPQDQLPSEPGGWQ